MPTRALVGIASILAAAAVMSVLAPSPASAEVIGGCDLDLDDSTPACLTFDSDHDGYVDPWVTITWPQTKTAQAGTPFNVRAVGIDVLRPATVGIHRLAVGEQPNASNLVASGVVVPGALVTDIPVTLSGSGPVRLVAFVEDVAANLYVWREFTLDLTALPTSLNSDLPPGRVVKVNTKAQAITGAVDGGARPVHVQIRAKDGSWVSVAQTASSPSGSYSVPVPTSWVGRHTYRVYAPGVGDLAAAIGTKTSTLTVTRTYKPRGSTAHAYIDGAAKASARWNACDPIRYAMNPALAPKWARSEYRRALREVTAATGLRFTYAGTSSFTPYTRNERDFPAAADMVLAWSTPKRVPGLGGSTVGLGGATYSGTVRYNGRAVFDATAHMTRAKWRTTILHEIGHVIGLGHVGDRQQIMFPTVTNGDAVYARGDLIGLDALGAGAGACTGEVEDTWTRTKAGSHGGPTSTPTVTMMP